MYSYFTLRTFINKSVITYNNSAVSTLLYRSKMKIIWLCINRYRKPFFRTKSWWRKLRHLHNSYCFFLGERSETPLEFKRYGVTVPMRSAFSTRLPSGDLFWTHLHWRKSYCEGRVRNSNLGYVRIRPVIAVDFCPTLLTTSVISRLHLQVR